MMKKWDFETDSAVNDEPRHPKIEVSYQPQEVEPGATPDPYAVHFLLRDDNGAMSVWMLPDTLDQVATAWLAMRKAQRKAAAASPRYRGFGF